ncbi:MAG TPA: hypothetical protein VFA05_10315 [Gaiellaceae bacterium]|nr:hypothetical protein [Gaiellaceae bacterium]
MKRGFVVAVLVAALASVTAGTAVAADPATCPSSGQATGGQFTFANGMASVPVTIAAGCTDVKVSLVSYEAPGPSWDPNTASQQVKYDFQTQLLSAGTTTLTVRVPDCYFQLDLVYGDPIDHLGPAGTNNFYGSQGRMIESLNGGTSACAPPPPQCPSSGAVSNVTPISVDGGTASVTYDVAPGCSGEVSLVSYEAPGPTYSEDTASQQVLYDSETAPFESGTHTLTVSVPSCYYQIDFVYGAPIDHLGPAGSNNFYSAQGRLIESLNGGTSSCSTSTTSTTTSTPTTTTTTSTTTTSTTTTSTTSTPTVVTQQSSTPQQATPQSTTPQVQTPAAPTKTTSVKSATKTITHKSVKAKPKKRVVRKHVVRKVVKARPKPVRKHAKPAKPVVSGAQFTG